MNSTVNPDLLILARDSRLMTQAELSQLTSIAQGYISKYEKGQLVIPEDRLRKLAQVLDYPVSFFKQKASIHGLGISNIYHRKRKSIPVQTLKQIQARINIYKIQIAKLLDGIELSTPYSFQNIDIDDFEGDAEYVAQLVRSIWRIPVGPIKNMCRTIEDASGIVIKCDFGNRKFDAEGMWLVNEGLQPFFFVNNLLPTDRMRFTLAHELGHIVMHRIPTPDMEAQADRFASEFLMPARDIITDLTPFSLPLAARLKEEWGVSIAALTRKARDLGVITQSQYRRFFTQLSAAGYRKHEPVELPEEKPKLINKIIDTYLHTLNYTKEQLLKLLTSNEDDFLKYYRPAPNVKLVR
ncbi:MAG: ImmA/IrrE family metallo-endopeptidase [Sedimentisphaerales bacterium]|nr:ImmA/IrrE family metallo-endopeptidase [Sedimentisphaerales bacterium]